MAKEKTAVRNKEELKQLALDIVRAQTNVYVKELLREHGVRIGATKADFDKNLCEAIDNGIITEEHLETWLQRVEGWGEQHVYAYLVTAKLAREFGTEELAHKRVNAGRLGKYWRKPTATAAHLAFPEGQAPELVSITFIDSLRFHWHKGTKYWVRTREEERHDKPRQWIEGFEYEFRAYRGRAMREVMRFEIRPADHMAALFIPKPVHSKEHAKAYEQAKETIGRVLDFPALEKRKLRIGDVIMNLDQKLTHNPAAARDIVPQSTRLTDRTASIEFAAASQQGSYFDSSNVKRVRSTLRSDDDIEPFTGAAGMFRFTGRKLGRVELFANDGRIRLWSSLTADDVWHILRTLKKHK